MKTQNGVFEEYDIRLSLLGKICREEIDSFARKSPDFEILASVIMPNHIHLLISIKHDSFGSHGHTNLSAIIGALKRKITLRAQGFEMDGKIWQRSFHDHIVRNEPDLERIQAYIKDNPRKWNEDCFFKKSDALYSQKASIGS